MRGGFNDSMHVKAHAARVSRQALVRSLEKRHPGMVVFTEPFLIQHPDLGKRQREIEACAAIKAKLQKEKVAVQVVLTSVGAYVLREKDGMHTSQSEKLKSFALKTRRVLGSKKGGS